MGPFLELAPKGRSRSFYDFTEASNTQAKPTVTFNAPDRPASAAPEARPEATKSMKRSASHGPTSFLTVDSAKKTLNTPTPKAATVHVSDPVEIYKQNMAKQNAEAKVAEIKAPSPSNDQKYEQEIARLKSQIHGLQKKLTHMDTLLWKDQEGNQSLQCSTNDILVSLSLDDLVEIMTIRLTTTDIGSIKDKLTRYYLCQYC